MKRLARESVYLPERQQVLFGLHFLEPNRLLFYDVASNAWQSGLVPGSEFFRNSQSDTSVDLGLQYDPARNLVWAVMCKLHPGAVQVLKIDPGLRLAPVK